MSAIELTHGDIVEIAPGETARVGIDGNFRVIDRGSEPGARVVQEFEIWGIGFSLIWEPKLKETKPYYVNPARYSKGNYLVRCPSPNAYKTRAARLIGDGLRGRWTNREGGYIVSPAKLKKFETLYAEGWDACTVTCRLISPKGETENE